MLVNKENSFSLEFVTWGWSFMNAFMNFCKKEILKSNILYTSNKIIFSFDFVQCIISICLNISKI